MILYHGSEKIIDKPYYHGGKPYNDYGYGFYCTGIAEMGKEWSVSPGRGGFLNKYEFDDKGLKILDLNDYPVIVWLSILLDNRTFDKSTSLAREADAYLKKEMLIDYGSFDVIVGYRADDSYFSFAQDFINGTISYEQLSEAMKLGELGNQYVLVSKKSYERIKWIGSEEVKKEIWLPKRQERDSKAREVYRKTDKGKYMKGALYITRILDEELKRDDPRLR